MDIGEVEGRYSESGDSVCQDGAFLGTLHSGSVSTKGRLTRDDPGSRHPREGREERVEGDPFRSPSVEVSVSHYTTPRLVWKDTSQGPGRNTAPTDPSFEIKIALVSKHRITRE